MSVVPDRKNISRLLCKKNALLCHGLLWPKIKKPTDLRLPIGHGEVLSAHLTDQIPYRRGNKAPDSPVYR